jgi:quercetin dioxygenase-like cupin family protein
MNLPFGFLTQGRGTPILKPSTKNDMKRSALMIVIGAALALASIAIAAEQKSKESKRSTADAAAQHRMLTPADLQWGEAPPGLPPGAKLAVLEGDPNEKGQFTIRLQFPDGYKVPPHTHPTAEKITVISGTVSLGTGTKFDEAAGKEMTAGSFCVMPAGAPHFGWAKGGAVLQVHGAGPFQIKYVNPADDPRQAKQ